MSEVSQFGSHTEISSENRLDVLNPEQKLSSSIKKSREVRKLLKQEARDTTWPQMPESLQSIEHFFDDAHRAVGEAWKRRVSAFLDQLLVDWHGQISESPENEPLIALLQQPEIIEEKLAIHQFGILEPLRKALPEAWQTLVLLASERQLAAVTLTKHWLKEIPADKREGWARQIGVESFDEVELMVDAAASLGKYIDHAYVKQIELADAPHGSDQSPLAKREASMSTKDSSHIFDGLKYLYDLTNQTDEGIETKTYGDMFPFEWPRVVAAMRRLADKVEGLLTQQKLNKTYRLLPNYLRLCADTYGSSSTDPYQVAAEWKNLFDSFRELMNDECPLMLIPQSTPTVTDKAGKVDVEIRLGLRTRESLETEAGLRPFYEAVKTISDKETASLEKPSVPLEMFSCHQPFAFGPNLYWMTRGEEVMKLMHTNSTRDVALNTALPLYKKAFTNSIDEPVFKKVAIDDCALHEWGHMVLPKEDTQVRVRIGATPETDVAEEIKADSGAIKIMQQANEQTPLPDLSTRLQAKLADICDYLANKSGELGTSGERYFHTGVAIISLLLEKKLIVEDGDTYKTLDDKAIVDAVSEFHHDFLELYRHGTPDELTAYIENVRAKTQTEPIATFIKKLRS